MQTKLRRNTAAACTSVLLAAAVANAALTPQRLRCEHLADPTAVERAQPRLEWVVASPNRGARQTAYQIQVATTRQALEAGEADRWDSGRVVGDRTNDISYAGEAPAHGQKVWWRVRVWDESGEASAWSAPATWRRGLDPNEPWQGDWIGYDAERVESHRPAPLEGAAWVLHAADDTDQAPTGMRLYVAGLELPEDAQVDSATVYAASDDVYWLSVNGAIMVHGEPRWERVKPVEVTDALRPGANELRFQVQNAAVGPSGLVARVVVRFADGSEKTLETSGGWLTVADPGQHWSTRPITQEETAPCRVVAPYGAAPWGEATLQDLVLSPAPRMRKGFTVDQPIDEAVLYVTALGGVDAYLNGERVSEERFTPGWTDYAKRVYYRAYDVTDLLQSGENVLGAELADGWYSGYIGWGRNRDHYGTNPRLRMQLVVRHADGAETTIATGSDWRARPGPTLEADFLMGETHDARLEDPAWVTPGADPGEGWSAVDVGADAPPRLEAHPGPPVVAFEELAPVSVSEPRPGVHIYNLGQNFAGVVRLAVRGEAGDRVRIRFAERLKPDGTLYTINLRGARATDTYVCRGGGLETWTPRHTFHGFQYVELTGLDEPPGVEAVTGVALGSETPRVGSFECSDPTLNRLVENIYWTQRSNFLEAPTDCPQRDERLGWTGDAQVYVGAACLMADVQSFFDKWLVDLVDSQREDGQFPKTAPVVVAGPDGGPAWADAGVICPWRIYEAYGDRELLRRSYPAMRRFVEFTRERSVDGVLPPDEYHCFGDWLSVNANTPTDVIYTAYHAHSARLLAHAAEALGDEADARRYNELADRIAAAFRETYVDADGVVRGDTQCGYVLALAYDLLDERQRAQAAERLVADIEGRGGHLSTGFVGTKDLMLVLAKIGRNDVACRLLHQDEYPSWGFSIRHGATSIWERWDGWTPDRGFQDPGMNSFAHYSFGAVYQWMAENLGGLRNGGDAYKRIVIKPTIDEQLDWARTSYDSVRGPIVSHWRKTADGLQLDVTLPANTTGEVWLPTDDIDAITLDGQPLGEAANVTTRVAEGSVIAEVTSGEYAFQLQ